jgi:putative membrane protein
VTEAAEGAEGAGLPRRRRGYTRAIFRAPQIETSLGLIVLFSAIDAAVIAPTPIGPFSYLRILVAPLLFPVLAGTLLTPALARAFGGKISLRRSVLLGVTNVVFPLPFFLLWRLAGAFDGSSNPSLAVILLLVQGPILWFRHMSLFGLAQPSHARALPASIAPPVLSILGVFAVVQFDLALLVEAALFLAIGLGASALLLSAADRPIRREFGASGVAMIRPLMDHINLRDPGATDFLERFFRRFAIAADLRVTVVTFAAAGRRRATWALPTVHPGPFAALGASDLPRKLAEALGADAGIVFVPHTPCTHDLDLPTSAEVRQVGNLARRLMSSTVPGSIATASGLVTPYAGSWARAQCIGPLTIVTVTQAPDPTDDIDFAVADRLRRELLAAGEREVALIDAHNSYVEDRGDLIYGTPAAEKAMADAKAAAAAARASARAGPVRIGVAARTDYSAREHGIGPLGIRALVVDAAGSTTAYALIDGNNLVIGLRARILQALEGVVTAAEIMTTDNHVVHEVDGGINPVGERFPVDRMARDVREVVERAKADLAPCELGVATDALDGVPVLGPGFTVRLLTSLGDTLAVFTNALLSTFLLVVTTSMVVWLALR